jgi:16S rRNA U516 pseudouridylate synthase RsuA-like enzyme
MVEALGSKVLKLVRTSIGPVTIGKLQIGKWRYLEADERRALLARLQNR